MITAAEYRAKLAVPQRLTEAQIAELRHSARSAQANAFARGLVVFDMLATGAARAQILVQLGEEAGYAVTVTQAPIAGYYRVTFDGTEKKGATPAE